MTAILSRGGGEFQHKQNDSHFAYLTFKYIFVNAKVLFIIIIIILVISSSSIVIIIMIIIIIIIIIIINIIIIIIITILFHISPKFVPKGQNFALILLLIFYLTILIWIISWGSQRMHKEHSFLLSFLSTNLCLHACLWPCVWVRATVPASVLIYMCPF